MGRPSHPRYDPSSPEGPPPSVPPTPRTAHTLYDLDKGSLVVRIEVPAEEATDVLAHLSKAGIVFDAEPRSDDEPETVPLRIVAVGAGVVGTAAGAALRDLGHDVVFADIDESVLTRLRAEGAPAVHMTDLDLVGTDIVLISVPTPTTRGQIDLRHVEAAAATIGAALARACAREPERYRVVIVRSTVPPGTTENLVIPLLQERSGLRAGPDFGVCMSPEYLRQWNAEADAARPWLAVIGELDDRSGELVERMNSALGCPIYHVPIRDAELHKYVHNLYNAAKISFFNEMRGVADAIDVDADRVFALVTASAEAMWNPAYGTLDLGAYDGCLSKDLQAFVSWAADRGFVLPTVSGIKETNRLAEQD